ncbi:unnamed protein product [Darwinula stevensoni]|uniref:Uncharacterized protein n=1 Tax=Darwinula stevensoni TaxID=69355 RepID=A0A7R9AJG8_9CRUS|nr:unnamed protein product [Darwinula stevensoni]CAG0908573.1 unnamed protein product [Darwinula stevensoni]
MTLTPSSRSSLKVFLGLSGNASVIVSHREIITCTQPCTKYQHHPTRSCCYAFNRTPTEGTRQTQSGVRDASPMASTPKVQEDLQNMS